MSIENPYSVVRGWNTDPDGRYDRSPGPVTVRKMTEEEIKKYGIAERVEVEDMSKGVKFDELNDETKALVLKADEGTVTEAKAPAAKLSKTEVVRLKAEGKSLDEIAEYFVAGWGGKPQLLKAKISLYMSDKKPGGMKKTVTNLPDQEISAINSHEDHPEYTPPAETSLKEVTEKAVADFGKVARDSMEKIKLSQAVDEMMELVPAADNINHPAHYTTGTIEVIDYLQDKLPAEMFEGFCVGNALKYLSRYKHKGGIEDLKKAQWYLNRIIGVMESA